MYSNKVQKMLKSKKIFPGDIIIASTKDYSVQGILMPKHEFGDPDSIVIKRSDGYNIGLEESKIRKISKVHVKKTRLKKEKQKAVFTPGKPVISILHTGGTIASRVDYKTGAVVSSFGPEDLIEMYPEMNSISNIRSRLLFNIFSEDMRFEHYRKIAEAVAEEIKKGAEGIIVTHGTDTLHYTSCALAFMLENLPVPVILVGAQRSSDRGSSDAFLNLFCAARFIIETDFSGVAICMHENISDDTCLILPPCMSRKMHSSRRDAFCTIDTKPIARVSDKIEFFSQYEKKGRRGKLLVRGAMEEKVGIIRIHPNISPKALDCFKNFRGLVMEGTGLGHAPAHHGNEKFIEAVKKLSRKTLICMTTQTIYGNVNMNVYSTGREYACSGAIPCPMTTEAAFIKLAWVLGNYPRDKKENIIKRLLEDVHGEIMEKIP